MLRNALHIRSWGWPRSRSWRRRRPVQVAEGVPDRVHGSVQDLAHAILCDREAEIVDGKLVTECPGDCLAHWAGWHGSHTDLMAPWRSAEGTGGTTGDEHGGSWLLLVRGSRTIVADLHEEGRTPEHERAVLAELSRDDGIEAYAWSWRQLEDGTIMRALQAAAPGELTGPGPGRRTGDATGSGTRASGRTRRPSPASTLPRR